MKILVLSDLHLSHSPFNVVQDGQRIDQSADVVVLAGDIDEGTKGFKWARETFPDKPIVMVAGNHEFYGKNWTKHVDDMREAARTYDIEFLETDVVELAGVRFLGCSLWTDFELFGPDPKSEAMQMARVKMNDYHHIKISRYAEFYWVKSNYLIPALTERRHRGSVEWLEQELEKAGDPAKTVIVTHHAPHANSIPQQFKEELLSASYASDLTRYMGKAGLWIHGHMHTTSDYTVNGTRIVCNPNGYMRQNGSMENDQFDPGLIVEI